MLSPCGLTPTLPVGTPALGRFIQQGRSTSLDIPPLSANSERQVRPSPIRVGRKALVGFGDSWAAPRASRGWLCAHRLLQR